MKIWRKNIQIEPKEIINTKRKLNHYNSRLKLKMKMISINKTKIIRLKKNKLHKKWFCNVHKIKLKIKKKQQKFK